MAEYIPMLNKLIELIYGFILIRMSDLFDKDWYLTRNPDVAQAKVNPWLHYLRYGGFEGRDPGPSFCSAWYLDTYNDVKEARINPLIHYLRYGRAEKRMAQPLPTESVNLPYKCPVCQKQVNEFLPLAPYYTENLRNYGFPYKPEEGETINFEQYACPHCSANDRDRLTACYLREMLPRYNGDEQVRLLDIAPSLPLSHIFEAYPVNRHTADLFTEGADLRVDITNMPEVASDSYDILICSHVLEHVNDDKKALSELYRILKPGGWGVIMVPIILTSDQIDEDPQITDEAERWRRFGQFDHVRLYNKSGFVERMESAGFFVHQLGVDYFGESLFKQFGITNSSILYIAEKKREPYIRQTCDFFFIIGTGRCGTTLLAQVLNAHSLVCIPSELQIAFETSNNGARLAEIFASRKNLKYGAADYIQLVKERCPHDLQGYYDYQSFFNRLDYPILSLQWLLTEFYTDIAYSQGKSIFAEQTPWYAKNIKLLNQLFPKAKFIHLVRDGRDVAISFARTPWWHKDVKLNLERWANEVIEIEEDTSFLDRQRILTLRYEDLVLKPEDSIQKVCDFLGITFEKTMLNPENHIDYGQFSRHTSAELSSLAHQKWQKEKKSAFFSDNVHGWKNNKEVEFGDISESVMQAFRHFGYED
jgi:SAM-dependent methyltransferase